MPRTPRRYSLRGCARRIASVLPGGVPHDRDLDPRGVVVPVKPDPLALAEGLVARGHKHVALLHAADAAHLGWSGRSFVAADPDGFSEAIDPFGEERPLAVGRLARAPRWIGVIPYEARRSVERPSWRPPDERPPALVERPSWFRYPAVACIDATASAVLVVGESARAAAEFAEALRRASTVMRSASRDLAMTVTEEEPPSYHAQRIAAARALILRGDLYQVNLARRLRIAISGGHPIEQYARLVRAAPAPYSAFVELRGATVLSTSPELLLLAEPRPGSRGFGEMITEPIKGTRPRGKHAAEDLALVMELDADPKERAELAMIVDVERNDLGRIAEVGSVRVVAPPHVVTHRTIHHRVARVRGLARSSVSRAEVLASMVPSGSVTGAPKIRAMEVIATLEARRRGLYTGGIGFVRYDGAMVLSMAIRTLVLQGTEGEYWTGGGIVADSDPEREVEETRWKALQLTGAGGTRR